MTAARTAEMLMTGDQLLPELVQTLVLVVGMRATLELIRVAGGTSIAVPKRQCRRGEASYEYLAEIVGHDAADALVRHFGGEILFIANCRSAITEYTHRKIRQSFDQMTSAAGGGMTATAAVKSLARKEGYSDRHIWSILKASDRQGMTLHDRSVQLGLF